MKRHYVVAAEFPDSGKCYLRKRWQRYDRNFGWTTERSVAWPFETMELASEVARHFERNEDLPIQFSIIEVTELEYKLGAPFPTNDED